MRRELLIGLGGVFLATLGGCGDDMAPLPPPPNTDPNLPLTPDEETLTPQQLLGKRLFEDTTLSEPPGVACISCHEPAKAFTGDHGSSVPGIAVGATSTAFEHRNAPTLLYASSSAPFVIMIANPMPGTFIMTPTGGLLLDGAMANLSDQAAAPFLDPVELASGSGDVVAGRVQLGVYAKLFAQVNGEGVFADKAIAFKRVQDAIAAYERSARFHPYSSKFDDVLRGAAQLTAQEAEGEQLFEDPAKGNCISCHVGDTTSMDPTAWPFTSHGYATLGAPRNAAIPANSDATYHDLGLCQAAGIAASLPLGFTLETLCGAFKVPTLRNVALTAPYMHNGAIASLRDAVKFHVTRDTNPEAWYPTVGGLVVAYDDLPAADQANLLFTPPFGGSPGATPLLDDAEIDAIVAFLGTLTDR